ncbi:MAG: tRNA pseudouridine(54/55) synthase Pus10 [Candidatus Micrarchaeota archaeon]
MQLCAICDSANGKRFPHGTCHICKGDAQKTEKMVEEASRLLAADGAKSFSISTLIPKDWLSREEKAWDISLKGAESVKNLLNRTISSALAKKAKAEYLPEGECRVVFDYSSGAVKLERSALFVFGRYKKISAGLSQSRWKCSKCDAKGCHSCEGKGKLYESVEERIGEPFKKASQSSDYTLHASGREDVDATNSAGRPFVLEITNPKTRSLDLDAIAREIADKGDASVSDLHIVPRSFVEVVTESHFDKSYKADIEADGPLDNAAIGRIRSIEGKMLLQKTPTRVAHRRADLVRHRRVKRLEVQSAEGRNATLIIKAEAGTYIKELISGDGGRTEPNISAAIGMKAVCKKLEVTEIEDGFLDLCLKSL